MMGIGSLNFRSIGSKESTDWFSAWRAAFMTEIEHLLASIDPLVRQYGLVVVPLIITLESLGAPLPGESLLIFASVMAEHGNMSFPLLLLFAWIGGVAGDNIGYLIGRRLGRVVLLRYGDKVGFTAQRLDWSRPCSRAMDRSPSRSPASSMCFASSTAWWPEP